jgi:hypothetical protein
MYRAEIKKDNVLTNYCEFPTVPECDAWIAENNDYFPAGYVSQIIDISALRRKQRRIELGRKRIRFGADVISEIVAINEERLELGIMTEDQFTALLNDPLLFKIERLLWNGSIVTAKTLIESMPDTHFNSTHKQYILDLINEFLTSIGE